jgi:hypothetical protein
VPKNHPPKPVNQVLWRALRGLLVDCAGVAGLSVTAYAIRVVELADWTGFERELALFEQLAAEAAAHTHEQVLVAA